MNRDELEKRNVGENLDALMNLDPRGYGVCRILYAGSRKATGEPLTMHAAQTLVDAVKPGDLVYILTGFVLLPHKVPEMDGMVSSMLLARALVLAFGAKPIIVCPEDSVQAVKNCAAVVGLHIYEDIADVLELPMSMGVQRFTKDANRAGDEADALLAQGMPAAVISIEAPGANDVGVYHNAGGLDVSALEAKSLALWEKLRAQGVPSVAIGDLGNEIRDMYHHGAALHAGLVLAVQAAGGFIQSLLLGVAQSDLVKVLVPDVGVLRGHGILLQRHIGHDYSASFLNRLQVSSYLWASKSRYIWFRLTARSQSTL